MSVDRDRIYSDAGKEQKILSQEREESTPENRTIRTIQKRATYQYEAASRYKAAYQDEEASRYEAASRYEVAYQDEAVDQFDAGQSSGSAQSSVSCGAALRCVTCDTVLSADEIGATKKMVNRGASRFYCKKCLAAKYGVTVEDINAAIERWRKMGCALFS